MTSERDHQISALFHAARELTAGQRGTFLAEACASDEELRQEVEALLEGDARAGDFLRQPLHEAAADLFGASPTSSFPPFGTGSLPGDRRLGRYRILSRLGAGGMGEVFLAEDTQLDRPVAVKLLPAEFTSDADRVRRFSREAKAASALNHPNILTIHEIGQVQTEAGSLHYIVTEYVDGQTLRERLAVQMSPDAALDVAIQVVGALAVAHQAGIIHRDIKPENLMLRRDGYVKLLDFGLAKLALGQRDRGTEGRRENASPSRHLPVSPSLRPSISTEPGMVMGTAHYMSPEQARGLTVDARTDIFSVGVVLYEMIAGRTPFGGVNAIEVMGAILNQEPAPLRFQRDQAGTRLADGMQAVIAKALRKDRAERYQSANDLLLDLKKLKEEPAAHAVTAESRPATGNKPAVKRRRMPWRAALLALALVAVGAAAYYALNRATAWRPGPLHVVPFASLPGSEREPAFSPDGNQLAFAWDGGTGDAQTDIYIKLIGAGPPLRLTNNPAMEASPTWSPDGRYIAFIRREGMQIVLMIMPALGGPERRLHECTLDNTRLSWSPDGKWLAMADKPADRDLPQIALISVETGERRPLTNPPPGTADVQPAFSPNGRQLAFARESGETNYDVFVIATEPGTAGGERRLTNGSRSIEGLAWAADGRAIIYSSNRIGNQTLWRVPATGGEPVALFSGGALYSQPAVSLQGGRLAFVERYEDTNVRRFKLPEASPREGGQPRQVEIRWETMTRTITSTREDSSQQFSPDGKKIAFVSNRSGSKEIWVCDSDGGNPQQLTQMGGAAAGSPHWSPDGRRLVFDARPETQGELFIISADGGAPRRLTQDPWRNVVPSWSHDGKWIYFFSRRSGRNEIWKMPAEGGQPIQITRNGGFEALEAPDGETVYYTKARGSPGMWSVPSTGGDERPVPELADAGFWRSWAMTNDGIYYVAKTDAGPPRPLKFFSFATRRVTQIGTIDRDPLWWVPGLSVSPDGRWLLYCQFEQNTSNIMLVDNFR